MFGLLPIVVGPVLMVERRSLLLLLTGGRRAKYPMNLYITKMMNKTLSNSNSITAMVTIMGKRKDVFRSVRSSL